MNIKILLCLAFILCFTNITIAEEIIIVNKTVTISSIDSETIQNIYLGRKNQWDNGSKIYPVMLDGGQTHENFITNVVKKTSGQFSAFWKKAIFTGQGKPPQTFASEAELVAYVAQTDNAIGYIDSSTPHNNVNVLTVK
jgi:ABC-type phosphate transport system substrate-binding protein